jgi:predicted nucleic acid-binding protein
MVKVFLDANIIADWLLITSNIEETVEQKRTNKIKELWKSYTSPKSSFEIIESLRMNKIKNFKFYSSDLALSEVSNVFYKEVFSMKLVKKGIAYRYLPKMIRNSTLSEGEINEITKKISNLRKELIEEPNRKIKLYNLLRDPTLPTLFITSFKIDVYDAFLISQAFECKCKYFITKDNDLIREIKTRGLDVVSPENFQNDIAKIKFDYTFPS